MTPQRESRPLGAATRTSQVQPIVSQPDSPLWDPDHWTNFVDWWENPALAYVAGLADGTRLERARIAAEDERLHRANVRRLFRTGGMSGRATSDGRPLDGVLVQAERREFADRGEPWPGDHPNFRYPIGDWAGVAP